MPPTRDELATKYLDQLPYTPYPVQEEALLAWFTAEQGVLVAAPTGTGKTLIAQAALFEALHTNSVAYYTTPLIALTEQKFQEMQTSAERWGFNREDVGLVTGNRRVNPNARVLVVASDRLGTINHTLLTLRVLKAEKLPILGVVLNQPTVPDESSPTNAGAISRLAGMDAVVRVPHLDDQEHVAEAMQEVAGWLLP